MPAVGEISFELERFEWTADDRLEVVGRWNGVRGRRISRPTLTVEAGGRRQRLSGSQVSEEPWSASFPWSGDDIAGAELEIGRALVVELPPPRRRRRRSGTSAESDLRAQLDETRAALAAAQRELAERERGAAREQHPTTQDTEPDDASAELAALLIDRDRLAAELEARRGNENAALQEARAAAESEQELRVALADAEAERDRLAAELEAARADTAAEQELAGLRLPHGSLRAAHEALEDEVEELRGVRDQRDELAGQIEQLRASAGDDAGEKSSLGDLVRRLQAERETLSADLAVAREEVARLERDVTERDR